MTAAEQTLGKAGRGAALIIVLWIMTLLALMSASLTLGIQREMNLGRYLLREVEMTAAIEAAVAYAFYRMHLPDHEMRWFPYGRKYRYSFEGIELSMELTDESGKLNLNQIKAPKMLRAILQAAGLKEREALKLTDAILDWTDRDDLRRPFGAEARDYEEAGLPYGPANAPFRSLEEVGMVLGMTPELLQRLLPQITVYSHGAILNPWTAPESLLKALPGVDPAALDLFLLERQRWQPGMPLPKPPAIPDVAFSQSQRGIVAFDITASRQKMAKRLYIVARLRGNQIEHLEWWSLPVLGLTKP